MATSDEAKQAVMDAIATSAPQAGFEALEHLARAWALLHLPGIAT